MRKYDYIDTERATIKILRDWYDQHWKLENSSERISELNKRMRAVKIVSIDSVPVQGGANKAEENLCTLIDRKALLEKEYCGAREYDEEVSVCWDRLTPDEQKILEYRWIDHENGNGIQRIMQEFNIEKSEAYRRCDTALKRLSKLLFW